MIRLSSAVAALFFLAWVISCAGEGATLPLQRLRRLLQRRPLRISRYGHRRSST